jgi:hypothetical protein
MSLCLAMLILMHQFQFSTLAEPWMESAHILRSSLEEENRSMSFWYLV